MDKTRKDMRGVCLAYADMETADLARADLTDADLSHARLRGVVLRGAILRGCDLRFADLTDGDLSGSDLRGADLCHANLDGAKLAGAALGMAVCNRQTRFPVGFVPYDSGIAFREPVEEMTGTTRGGGPTARRRDKPVRGMKSRKAL